MKIAENNIKEYKKINNILRLVSAIDLIQILQDKKGQLMGIDEINVGFDGYALESTLDYIHHVLVCRSDLLCVQLADLKNFNDVMEERKNKK